MTAKTNLEEYTKYSILIIILFSIIVFTLASIYHVSGDGCWHIPLGKFIANNHRIPLFEPLGRDEPFWSPPVYHMIVAAVYSISNSDFAVKFISPFFGILTLTFSFLIIKKLFNPKLAFYSTLFLAFVPIFLDYSILSYVDITLTFLVVLSVYFLINNRIALSGITAGLSILTKYNGAFVLPVLIFILYKRFGNKKEFYKKALIVIALSLLIAAPWLIRNWILLQNPIWPFLNFIFNGYPAKSYSGIDFGTLADQNLYAFTYLGFFGVPDGNYKALSLIDMPYFGFLFIIWLIGTFIFILPLITGILSIKNIGKKFKNYAPFMVWIVSYLILFLAYVLNVGLSVSRMLLPAVPAFALFWAFGYYKLTKLNSKKIFFLLIIFAIFGFVFVEFAKIKLAANSWNFYEEDFGWVRKNTAQDSIFIANGQCVPYNIQRTSVYLSTENLEKADYIWVNQNFKLDRRSIFEKQNLDLLQSKNYNVAYRNQKTGTIIYEKPTLKTI